MFVANLARDSRHQDIVINSIEEFLQIKIHDNLAPLLSHVFPRLFQSLMSAPFRTESVAGVRKGGIEDGIQYLQDRLLNEPVHHVWNSQLALASSRLSDLHSTHWVGLVGPVQQ